MQNNFGIHKSAHYWADFFNFTHSEGRIDGFEVTFTSFPEGRTYTPPKGDVCALRGNEKATQFSERMQTAK